MGIATTLKMVLDTIETVDVAGVAANNRTITFNAFSLSSQAIPGAANTPPGTKCAYFTKALVDGGGVIDLTALPHQGAERTVDGTGLKVQAVIVKNNGANDLVIEPGDATAYELLGAAFKDTIKAGQMRLFYLADGSPDVAAGAKLIKLTGTGTQTSNWGIVLG